LKFLGEFAWFLIARVLVLGLVFFYCQLGGNASERHVKALGVKKKTISPP
jgi:hypothetical protein